VKVKSKNERSSSRQAQSKPILKRESSRHKE